MSLFVPSGKSVVLLTVIVSELYENEMLAAKRDIKRRQRREVTFSDLTSQEEKQLFVCDQYFADDEAEKSFVIAGKEIIANCLPKLCTPCRKKSAKPSCCIISLI